MGGDLRVLRRLLFGSLIVALTALPGEAVPSALGRSEEPAFTLALVGDVMLGRGVAQALDGDWEAAFAQVRPWLAGNDGATRAASRSQAGEYVPVVAFANLESPLTTASQVAGGYDLRAPPGAVAALEEAGFDVVSLANNHALDAGEGGVQETVGALRTVGIGAVLHGEAVALDVPACRLLALDDSVVPLDLASATSAVTAAAERADVVVVSVHWGGEYQAAPGPRQRAIARELAGAGADLVVGHGPHVLQRIEWVGETLVAYSLGNFLFDQPYPADCRWGAILRVTFQGDRIAGVEAVPTISMQGRVGPADPEDAATILDRLALDAAGCVLHPASNTD